MPTNAHALSRPARTNTAPVHTSQPEESSLPQTSVPELGADTFSASKSRLRKAARTVMFGLDLRPPAPILPGSRWHGYRGTDRGGRGSSNPVGAHCRRHESQSPSKGSTRSYFGLYALGMVMDFWNEQDRSQPTVLVSDKDLGGQGYRYNGAPTSNSRMLDYVREAGTPAQERCSRPKT